MTGATLIEFGGLPGTGKSTLAGELATRTGAVWLRVDEIEAAMRRTGLPTGQTGLAAYAVAHDVAANHLRRGLAVIVDAVNPVAEARDGWRDLARECAARHVVIETRCPDPAQHEHRIRSRPADIAGWIYPQWTEVSAQARSYQVRADERLVVDTTRPVELCHREVARYVAR